MNRGTTNLRPLSVFNNIVLELKVIEWKFEDEDKVLRLILSFTSLYEHINPIMMYEKEDVTNKLLSKKKT